MRALSRPVLVGVTASGLMHVLAWQQMPKVWPSAARASVEAIHSIELTLANEAELKNPQPLPSAPVLVVPPPPSAQRTLRAKRPAIRRAEQFAVSATKIPAASTSQAPALSPTEPTAKAPNRKVSRIDLSPLAASRSVFDVRAAPAVPAPSARARGDSDPEARLDAYLDQVASSKPWLSRSDDPVLVREPDGSLSHDGNGFDAVIEPDGRVRFDDKYLDFDLTFKPMVSPDGTVTISFFKVTMAIDVWIDKLFGKGDPFRAERRWFLERTAQLREERIQKHWQRVAKQGVIALRHKLQDIWHDASLDIPRRKELTFAHWDGCADDEVGVLGKAVVEGFVRERLPLGSRWAFQQDELSAFNAKRKSRAPFAPYTP